MRPITYLLQLLAVALLIASCGGSTANESLATADTSTDTAAQVATTEPVALPTIEATEETAIATEATAETIATTAPTTAATQVQQTSGAAASVAAPSSCADTAALFVTTGSANPSLADPEVAAACTGDQITITSNGIPDYTYIETSPGDPAPQNLTFVIPATPTATSNYTDVPLIGPVAVALNGVPIYGPTEGQGGDVLSLGGALSECGSHNGPTGFHMHLFGTSTTTDCINTPEQVASAPQLVGYAIDGYPIYTGNDHYTSSWTLTDASLFATDTWAAHSYVAGSGDLDQCNGLTDEDGNYAYYTTDTFPYVIGCYAGEIALAGSGAGGNGGLGGPADGQAPPADDNAAAAGGPPAGGAPAGDAPAGGPPAGGAPAAGGQPDFTDAAAVLGVTVEQLEAALGEPPIDLATAAAALGVTVEQLEAALPAPPG